jgi:hypothetical protein
MRLPPWLRDILGITPTPRHHLTRAQLYEEWLRSSKDEPGEPDYGASDYRERIETDKRRKEG